MLRRLILITYNGGPSNYLPGVEKDRIAYLDYFKSKTGGLYSDNEIIEFHNSTKLTCTFLSTKIQLLVSREYVDFLTIVFCGHGYGLSNGDTVMVLGPSLSCSVMNLSRICQNVTTLLISDCCRASLLRVAKPYVLGSLFNVAFAARVGEFALEDKEGGIYTQHLIKTARIKQIAKKNYSISNVHAQAAVKVYTSTGKQQRPEITGPCIDSIGFSFK